MRILDCADFYRALIAGPYAWPGGYPVFFIMADGEPLSFESARENTRAMLNALAEPDAQWRPIGTEINWEDSNLYCAHSGKRIESAYAEPEESAS